MSRVFASGTIQKSAIMFDVDVKNPQSVFYIIFNNIADALSK